MNEYNKIKKGKNSVERGKNQLFLYKSSEDLINVKQKQLKNISKLNVILDKDISKINFNLKKGYYIDQRIQEENPEIRTKKEELSYIYDKLITEIATIKNDISVLKNIKDAHNKCGKQILKLNKELETLKERKDLNINYSEIKAKDKEMNEIKRKQIIAFRALDSTKFQSFMNSNKKHQSISNKNKKNIKLLDKVKNKFFITSDKNTIDDNLKNISLVNKELKSDLSNANYNNININGTYDKFNDNSVENKYKFLLKTKIEEKNKNKRKINSELIEINKEKTAEEEGLKEKELKKLNLQKSNYDLENSKKLNEQRIKKLSKQLNELKIQEKNYENQIIKKKEALEKLKKIVDSVNSMQQLRE